MNKKETVHNYYYKIYFCEECVKKDPDCNKSRCNGSPDCNCEGCNTFYPLKFKFYYKEENKEKIIDLEPIEKPKNTSYIILESLEYECKNQIIKSIHVINLNNKDEIIIGNDIYNDDVILEHSSINEKHAVIRYNNGEILLKNLSKKAGTLVLIQKKKILLSPKELFLQVNKTFIEAKIMDKKKFKANEETILYDIKKENNNKCDKHSDNSKNEQENKNEKQSFNNQDNSNIKEISDKYDNREQNLNSMALYQEE